MAVEGVERRQHPSWRHLHIQGWFQGSLLAAEHGEVKANLISKAEAIL
jgi:hypothetical protein